MHDPMRLLSSLALIASVAVLTPSCAEPEAPPGESPDLGSSTDELLHNTGGKRWCDDQTIGWYVDKDPRSGVLRQCYRWHCCDRIGNKPLANPSSFENCGYDRINGQDGNPIPCKAYCVDLNC